MAPSLSATALATALLTLVLGQSPSVPSKLLDAAQSAPFGFVASLLRAGVPAGIEVRERDAKLSIPVSLSGDSHAVPLTEVLEAFTVQHPSYRVSTTPQGVVNIRPAEGRAAFLESQAPLLYVHAHGIMAAANNLFEPLQTTKIIGLGTGGSSMGNPREDRGEDVDIALDTVNQTVLDALNATVVQAPTHAWMVVTKDSQASASHTQIVRVGFIHSSGTLTERVFR